MADMNALERQVAGEVLRSVGPVRPVDDLAIYEAVTAASRAPRWRFTMSSAVKFVAAGVIVALFGGFLLAGILTTPQQDGDVLPAAVTESPEPTTTAELLSGMVTEEVEPGVYRVINDGVRDAMEPEAHGVVVGADGSVWLLRDADLVRLGSAGSYQYPASTEVAWSTVTEDGTVWMGHWPIDPEGEVDGGLVHSLEDGTWTERYRGIEAEWVTMAPDGTLWATYRVDEEDPERTVVARLGADGLEQVEVQPPIDAGIEPDDLLFLTRNGDIWLVAAWGRRHDMWRYGEEGDAWHEVTVDAVGGPLWTWGVEVGVDGTVWFVGVPGTGSPSDRPFLTRFDGDEWQRWGPTDGMPSLASDWGVSLSQAADGGLWMSDRDDLAEPPCPEHMGAVRFDGTDWQHFLSGHCVTAMEVAPDGSVWLKAASDHPDHTWGLYVITPEAVAATE